MNILENEAGLDDHDQLICPAQLHNKADLKPEHHEKSPAKGAGQQRVNDRMRRHQSTTSGTCRMSALV
jgi:hypothetical protein